ncbi:MAG: peptide chain release factor N(5)-glutamine methyltransferase [Clostridia bacterium]
MTVNAIYLSTVKLFEDQNILDANLEVRYIIEKALDFSHTDFILRKNFPVSEEQTLRILGLAGERLSGVPIQYVLGKWEFMGEDFFVGAGVLIPRPETEILVEKVIQYAQKVKNPVVFDLCSGSGCIGISVKNAVPNARVVLVEKSDQALVYLKKNVEKFGFSDKIQVIQGDILALGEEFSNLPEPNIIVSNPPYIKSDEVPTLQSEVLFEPKMALDGGADGYVFYKKLTQLWLPMIQNGRIMIECGEAQASTIEKMFASASDFTEIVKDYNKIDRIVIGGKNNDN